MDNILSVKNLSVSFFMYQSALKQELVSAMHDVNIEVKKGEIVAIVGASGSGKSLLAHAILGILPYNAKMEGSIFYKGAPLDSENQAKLRGKEIALIPQSVTYLDPLMKIAPQVIGLYGQREDMEKTFTRLDLMLDTANMYPFQLSGGMARRVLFSTAVITDAELIIADEPTPGMDVKSAVEALKLLRELADLGKGILLITHDMDLAVEVADFVSVFYEGKSIDFVPSSAFKGDGKEIKHPYTRALYEALPQNDFRVLGMQEVEELVKGSEEA